MGKLFNHAPVDNAADQMGQKLMHVSLPPYLAGKSNFWFKISLLGCQLNLNCSDPSGGAFDKGREEIVNPFIRALAG